jgi:glutamine synthetase adenylyltransferase
MSQRERTLGEPVGVHAARVAAHRRTRPLERDDPLQTARDLSALARAVLPALWEQVAPDQTLWLIGFGSLGAGELGYQSDWDLAFACPDDADLPTLERHAQAFLAHCQRLTEQGVFPPVDTQLRP